VFKLGIGNDLRIIIIIDNMIKAESGTIPNIADGFRRIEQSEFLAGVEVHPGKGSLREWSDVVGRRAVHCENAQSRH